MSKAQILIEELLPSVSNLIISEDASGGNASKTCWLAGTFMQAEISNRNGRNYPLSEIAKACESAQATIKEANGIFGELDHPQSLQINLDRISHVITDLHMQGNNAVGKAKILPTPMGSIARTLIESGTRIGVSSRGAGTVGANGLVEGFNLVTVDLVAVPSAPGAMPNSIYESLQQSIYGKEILSLSHHVKHDPKAQEYLKKEIQKFLAENLFSRYK